MAKVLIPEAATDIFQIPVNLIVADPKQNTRKTITNIKELASTIKTEGQQTPVLVAKREDGKFDLIYGFRRFYAISWPKDKGGLEGETIKARVVEPMDPQERMLTNLIENMAREDLSSFDTAMACKQLRDLSGGELTGAKIANRVGKSQSYVNNLLKAVDNLPPMIIQRWKDEQSPDWHEKSNGTKPVLTTDNLNKLSKDSMTEEERLIEYQAILGGKKDKKDKSSPKDPNAIPRASKDALTKALEAAKGIKKKDARVKGIIEALNFALGETDGIKDVYKPEEKSEET